MGASPDHSDARLTQNADIGFADQNAQRNIHQVVWKRSGGEFLMTAIYIESSAILEILEEVHLRAERQFPIASIGIHLQQFQQ